MIIDERKLEMTKSLNLRQEYGVTHTLEETARLMGITRERVRQIEKKALQKIKKAHSLYSKFGSWMTLIAV